MTDKTEDAQVAQRLAEIRERRAVRGDYPFIPNAASDIDFLLSLVDEPPAEAPLTDAEVNAYLEAHKNDPVDEDQARRVERLFRERLATDALNAGREWLQSYQEDVVKGGRRVKHDTELLYSGTKTLIENLVRVIDTLALVDTARPLPRRWACACGWRGTPDQMTVSNDLRTCPDCGGSGGLVLDVQSEDAQVAQGFVSDEELAAIQARCDATDIPRLLSLVINGRLNHKRNAKLICKTSDENAALRGLLVEINNAIRRQDARTLESLATSGSAGEDAQVAQEIVESVFAYGKHNEMREAGVLIQQITAALSTSHANGVNAGYVAGLEKAAEVAHAHESDIPEKALNTESTISDYASGYFAAAGSIRSALQRARQRALLLPHLRRMIEKQTSQDTHGAAAHVESRRRTARPKTI